MKDAAKTIPSIACIAANAAMTRSELLSYVCLFVYNAIWIRYTGLAWPCD